VIEPGNEVFVSFFLTIDFPFGEIKASYLPLLTESSHNHTQSNPDPANPITFTHVGSIHPAITMGTPVATLKKCSMATMPKMVPDTRNPRIFEFIDMIR